MKLKVLVFLAVMAFSLFFQSNVFSDELSDLRDEMRMMEERHQNEMSMMKERMDKLEEEAQAKSDRAGLARADSPAASMEGATDLEGELVYLREQQTSLLNRLDRMVEFDLYATLEFENFEGSDSALDARNVELLADARMTDRLRVYAEIEFERASAVGEGRGAVEVEQGWLEYAINPYVNPRFGVVLVPFGRYNLEHFQPFQDLTDRPVAMSRVVPVTWAEAGAGFTGSTGVGDHLSINHQFFLINGLTNDFTDTSPRGARGSFEEDNNNNKAFVGRLAFTPVDVIPLETEIGLSGYWGEYDDADHEIGGFDVDWKFVKGPFELVGEYAFLDLEEGGIQSDELTAVPGFLSGYYVQFNYHFWFDALNGTFLGRGFESPTFTAVVRYGQAHIDDDTDEDTGDNDEDQWVIGLNYRPVETWVLKLEYQMNQTDNESLDRGDSDGFISSVTAAF